MSYKYDLAERLINFASDIIDITESLPRSFAGSHLGSQLLRSGTSPALHYGEAQSAESRSDFIHKMKVCLKELRESFNCLRLIAKKSWLHHHKLDKCELCGELIAIFMKSIDTAKSRAVENKR